MKTAIDLTKEAKEKIQEIFNDKSKYPIVDWESLWNEILAKDFTYNDFSCHYEIGQFFSKDGCPFVIDFKINDFLWEEIEG